jgi:YebC/PmpR family DNA-binding regulatory protein
MSGHNKWSTIKHKKGKADAARGKLFTKLIKELTVAARMGGGNEEANARLRSAIAAAKAANMPSDNVTRAIKKGTGELEGVAYEEVTYEGYGPDGVAILVDCVTDNKNRCVSEVRHVFTRHAGKMAEMGAVSWVFKPAGRIVIKGEGVEEDALLMAAMEAGADDVVKDEENFVVTCPSDSLETTAEACRKAGYTVEESGRVKLPSTSVQVEGKSAASLLKLLDALESLDDTQNVWANFDMDDSLLEEMA